jgi:AbrB family looped-hinge helix DNA binding protein
MDMSTKAAASTREPVGRVGQRRQVVIPRDICETLRLQEGDFVAFSRQPNGVLIKPKRLVDPDDVLSVKEGALLRKAEKQIRQGQSVTLAKLEHELERRPRARSRKTA